MKWIGIILISVTALFLQYCRSDSQKTSETGISENHQNIQKEIIVYGSKTCPHCLQFIRELEKHNISYTFLEVDNSDDNFQEMYDKIKSINYEGYVSYPVVDVGGEILVAPEYDEFVKKL